MSSDNVAYQRGCMAFHATYETMTIDQVLYHWWMWAFHKGAASYYRAMTFDA